MKDVFQQSFGGGELLKFRANAGMARSKIAPPRHWPGVGGLPLVCVPTERHGEAGAFDG